MSRKDIEPGDIVAVADTREKAPLDLKLKTVTATLFCADYSIVGLEHLVAVERKSLEDLIGCVGRDRDRFEACIQRMKGYETRVLVVEASWGAVELGQWRGKVNPSHVKGALYSWMKHVSVVFTGDRQAAADCVSGILFSAARARWRELQAFYGGCKIATKDSEAVSLPDDPAPA